MHFYDAVYDFVEAGLTRNERIFVYTDGMSVAAISEALRVRGIDLSSHEKVPILHFGHSSDSYLSKGHFDVDATVNGWFQLVERAVADGFDGIRVVGDMGWAARGVSGSDRIFEYERAIQREVFSSGRVAGLCGYDVRRFDSSALRIARELHARHVLH